jgi:fructokinase
MRFGIDLGGTKIAGIALDDAGAERGWVRVDTPQGDYEGTIRAVAGVVADLERQTGARGSVGVGTPGTIARARGVVKNANSVCLNGKPFDKDLAAELKREVRCANDANCLAVSEATDGAAAGMGVVFAVILGTGCGAGIALHGRVHEGLNGVAGEWGHNSLPWPRDEEFPGPACYCGKRGCIETWVSGTGLENDYARATSTRATAVEIARWADEGKADAVTAFERYEDRLARSLIHVVHVLDPDVIVIGGGISNVSRLYGSLPAHLRSYAFGGDMDTPIVPAMHGDVSGVRGAAWLWGRGER